MVSGKLLGPGGVEVCCNVKLCVVFVVIDTLYIPKTHSTQTIPKNVRSLIVQKFPSPAAFQDPPWRLYIGFICGNVAQYCTLKILDLIEKHNF